LRTRKAGAVGLLLTENLSYAFRDPAALGFLEGLALACEGAGQGLHLVPVNPEREDVTAVHSAGVDGFVVYSVPDDDPHLAAVLSRPVPTVVCDQPSVEGVDLVGIDDHAAISRDGRCPCPGLRTVSRPPVPVARPGVSWPSGSCAPGRGPRR
jgi:DNA-binding LacI/PurR family transcriptional regulator